MPLCLKRPPLTYIIIFLLCLVPVFLVGTTPYSNPYDYPFYVISADRVLHGERPYADFAVVYGPLGYYINAAGLWVLQFLPLIQGFNLLSVIFTAFYLLFFISQLSQLTRPNKLLISALFIYIIGLLPIIAHYAYYSLLPVLMLAIAVRSSQGFFATVPIDQKAPGQSPALIILAVTAVVAVLTRINFGVYILFSVTLVSLLHLFAHKRQLWNPLVTLVAIIASLGLLAGIILYFSGILLPYIQDMVMFLPRYKARHLPIMYSSSPTEVLLTTALLIIILVAAFDLIRRKLFGAGLVGAIIIVCLFQYSFQRLDVEHLYCVFLLLPFVYLAIHKDYQAIVPESHPVEQNSSSTKTLYRPSYVLRALLALMLLVPIIYFYLSNQIIKATSNYWFYNYTQHRSFINDGVLIFPSEMSMLQRLASEKDGKSEIFWGSLPGCCESTTQVGANLSLYLAQGRLPTSRIWYFDPCSTAHADVQQILINDLEAKKFKRIAMQGMIDPTIGYLPGNPPESRLFFDYVQSKYTLRERYIMQEANRYYDIYVRNGVDAPAK